MAWTDWTGDCTTTDDWVVSFSDIASLTTDGVGITNTATQLLDYNYEDSKLRVNGPTGIDGNFVFTMNISAPAPNLSIQNISWSGMYFTADADSYFRVTYYYSSVPIAPTGRYFKIEFYNWFDPDAGGWEDTYETQVDIEDNDAHDYVLKITRVGAIFRAYLDDVLFFEKLDDTEAQTLATTSIRWLYQAGENQDDWTPEKIYLTGISLLHPGVGIAISTPRLMINIHQQIITFARATVT